MKRTVESHHRDGADLVSKYEQQMARMTNYMHKQQMEYQVCIYCCVLFNHTSLMQVYIGVVVI